jgi:hypothetical protein
VDATGFFQGGNISRGQLIPAIGEEIRVDQARRVGAADRFRHVNANFHVLRELETTERPQDSSLKIARTDFGMDQLFRFRNLLINYHNKIC